MCIRDRVLILGSGNLVHHLLHLNPRLPDDGYDWAVAFDQYIKSCILKHAHTPLLNFKSIENKQRAFSTDEHFLPLLTLLGATTPDDAIEVWNEAYAMGSLSMTSYLFREQI